ncbi:hypothetical protein NEOLEDRAFT_92912 [Neolentinus lepideus HHB14362 ss-1]|uniref:Uncharacterized protein n=1 Tax=Neolentinus lepideus HHB14362 ss-1 TaxID=1314782 RepID=A0A165U264_9AGAM|nr:hypothetical protein NEOLEDRAFT_92912 [Neolentinus lepideus HHB14362 ss-1]
MERRLYGSARGYPNSEVSPVRQTRAEACGPPLRALETHQEVYVCMPKGDAGHTTSCWYLVDQYREQARRYSSRICATSSPNPLQVQGYLCIDTDGLRKYTDNSGHPLLTCVCRRPGEGRYCPYGFSQGSCWYPDLVSANRLIEGLALRICATSSAKLLHTLSGLRIFVSKKRTVCARISTNLCIPSLL